MGGGKWNEAGGRGNPETFQYESVGEIGGVKIVVPKDPTAPGVRPGLPMFSNTLHTYYFNRNDKGEIDQLRVYRGGVTKLQVDWGHDHLAKRGETPDFERVHVHDYRPKKNGGFERSPAREMEPREWKVLKKLLLLANKRLKR